MERYIKVLKSTGDFKGISYYERVSNNNWVPLDKYGKIPALEYIYSLTDSSILEHIFHKTFEVLDSKPEFIKEETYPQVFKWSLSNYNNTDCSFFIKRSKDHVEFVDCHNNVIDRTESVSYFQWYYFKPENKLSDDKTKQILDLLEREPAPTFYSILKG